MHFQSDLSFFYGRPSLGLSAHFGTRGLNYSNLFPSFNNGLKRNIDFSRIIAAIRLALPRLMPPPTLRDAGIRIKAKFSCDSPLTLFVYYGKGCDVRIKFDLRRGLVIVSTREKSVVKFSRHVLPSSMKNLPVCIAWYSIVRVIRHLLVHILYAFI
ncbi:uncharacterized protein LOC143911010 [Arctopsyche grandis]|uniref:uncharacterized protein LOC143911010 n=1 Tax=Arctopsyche grandis TaxID=121162 RepID=UPI00406D78DF